MNLMMTEEGHIKVEVRLRFAINKNESNKEMERWQEGQKKNCVK